MPQRRVRWVTRARSTTVLNAMSSAPTPAERPVTDQTPAPGVSVVVPVLNEERHLRDAVDQMLEQAYPGPLEVVLALGPSRDRTDAIAAEISAADARVRLVANPTGRTPAGLNAAIAAASYDVIVRVDGHALVPDDYVAAAVETLGRTGADNVGIFPYTGLSPFGFNGAFYYSKVSYKF